MGFKEFTEDAEKAKTAAEIKRIARLYHDIERVEIIDNVCPSDDLKVFFYRDDTIFKEMFEGEEDADQMLMMLNVFSETGSLDKLGAIFEMMDGGEEISAIVNIMKTIKSMEKTFGEHYNSVAKEIVNYANNKGIPSDDAVKKKRVRDSALKKVLKTREEYAQYSKADAEYLKSIVGTIESADGQMLPDKNSEFNALTKKMDDYHSERMDKLYRDKR
ncbi:MAG: hypothetical protein HZB68_01105 [Candidatus Aenigmarchaeota archaeon]|nr:hypothetical protein [Candidatus Aenigmarchaeota archaeon]